MTNPYSAPNAAVTDPKPLPGSPIKALLLGLLIDIGGSTATSFVLAIGYGILLASQGQSPQAIQSALEAQVSVGEWGFAIGLALGCGFSVLGGYVCARISRRTDERLGWIMGGIAIISGMALSWEHYPFWGHMLLSALTFACVLFGIRRGMPRAQE